MNNLTVKDALIKIINSEDCVNAILENNKDKIYLYAKSMKKSLNSIDLALDSKNCIVTLNDNVTDSMRNLIKKYNVDFDFEIITVSQIRSGEKAGFLFSAGVIAKNNDNNCLMMERDNYAPSEKNCWQFPAGRCEEIISINTARNEISEEITVTNPIDDSIVSIADKIVTNDESYTDVNFYVDSKLIVKNKNYAVIDKDFNTLEQFYFSELDDVNTFVLKDNEYDRKVEYVSLEMLKNNEIKMVNLLNKEKPLFVDCFKPKKKHNKRAKKTLRNRVA